MKKHYPTAEITQTIEHPEDITTLNLHVRQNNEITKKNDKVIKDGKNETCQDLHRKFSKPPNRTAVRNDLNTEN